jgi:phosphatidylinositol glycan class U
MFDHFRPFFLAVFQLHIFIYVAPAAIKFKSDPIILAAFLAAVPSIFKPYPVLADSVLLLTFISFVGEGILKKSAMVPLYLFALVAFSLIGPINWHYWIQQGSGNANFFYATTLLYNGSHIFLVLDVVYQWMHREIERSNSGVDLSTIYQY